MKIEGLTQLKRKFNALVEEAKRQTTPSVVVGFTTNYAVYVHENVEMKWRGRPRDGRLTNAGSGFRNKSTGRFAKAGAKGVYWGPNGQAKFLEEPARLMQPELARLIADSVKNGVDLRGALLIAGLRLQRAAQERVPILTGTLRASAFTRVEDHS